MSERLGPYLLTKEKTAVTLTVLPDQRLVEEEVRNEKPYKTVYTGHKSMSDAVHALVTKHE